MVSVALKKRQKAASGRREGGMDGWWRERRNEGNRDETFEGSLQSLNVTQKMEGSQSG